MKFNAKLLLCLISAILTALPFLVPSFSFLAYFSLIPFLYVLFYMTHTAKDAAKYGFIFGAGWYLLVLTWIFYLYPLENVCENAALCILLLFFVWILISFIMALEIALFSAFFKKCNTCKVLMPYAAATLWIVMEFFQQFGEAGFTWCRISLTQYIYTPIIQSASLFGGLFLSFIIVFINALLVLFIKDKKALYLAASAGIFAFNILLGAAAPDLKPYKEISASLVWEDINPDDKRAENTTEQTFKRLMGETKKQQSELVLWTETAVPVVLTDQSSFFKEYQALCREKKFTLLAGGFTKEGERLYSSVICINRDGERIGSINKRHLVPFGEYVPLRNFLRIFVPAIDKISPPDEEIAPFEGSCVIDSEIGKIGGIVCYDSCFPALSRESVRDGAQIITISTNDSWFYGSHAAKNHLSQSVFRAVENGRYVLRSANLGESCIIDNEGRIVAEEEEGKNSLSFKAGLIKENTLYTKIGDSFVIISVLILIVAMKKRGV